ncbi:hypothetical protein [Ornithinibacillus halotolerans]|uniref:Uncharacterized protein n=1 Tax=Ornithinibacillus halotolerans TaxID=1274357 RepID=A0A916RZT8_9BACI|nr:hypothetical protein [Ornithinibacillus halotolerans]GGA77795.1 hypothetical protein GCM10008025_21600 [Ornithinibacillus halotolerans]
MSLANVNLSNIVIKQYRYKMKSFIGVFLALMVIQVFGILISMLGASSSGFSNGFFFINVTSYTANVVIAFTMIWAFTNAIIVTTKSYREDDFTFISNRLSYNLSNILFLITACVIGAITAFLSRGVIYILVFFVNDLETFLTVNQEVNMADYLIGVLATILIVLLAGAAGYVVGMLFQLNKLLIFILPVFVFGLDFIRTSNESTLQRIFEFYFTEQVFTIFVVKTIMTILLGFGLAALLTNRMEVRR